jgi:biotin synthase
MGMCPEDCKFCSQSTHYKTGVQKYKMLTEDEIIKGAYEAKSKKSYKYCIVTSTRGPSKDELETVCRATKKIKEKIKIKICTSLGILDEDMLCKLKEAQVDTINHNIETSKAYYPSICSTHSFEDRVRTVSLTKKVGLHACCGGIIGMGEKDIDIVNMAFTLKELAVDSIPINFLDSRHGTPFGTLKNLTPQKCLKAVSMLRFVHPDKEIRLAGGREVNLGDFQNLGLYVANSIFTDRYLTTQGQGLDKDLKLIEDLGFEVE